jgi:hypothetical protein
MANKLGRQHGLRWKADGVDAAGLQTRVGASMLTLGGLLKHLAFVEVYTFTSKLRGGPPGRRGTPRRGTTTRTGSSPPPPATPPNSSTPSGTAPWNGPAPGLPRPWPRAGKALAML